MTTSALLTSCCYVDGWDATGDAKSLMITGDAKSLDDTTFRAAITNGGWSTVRGGAKKFTATYDGWWSAAATAAVDNEAFANLGAQNRVFTSAPAEVEGDPAWMWKAGHFKYQAFGTYGTIAPFSLSSSLSAGDVGLVRGQLAKKYGTVAATGALGTGLHPGAVGASQKLYATFHVFSAGTTITVVVESDDNAGFTSATTRATIGPLTTTGGTWITPVSGAITDDYFRLRVTAITGTFTVAGAIAVQ